MISIYTNDIHHVSADTGTNVSAGRIQTVLAMRVVGALCLLLMGMHQALWAFPWAMIPVVLLRTGALDARNTRALRILQVL